MAKFFDTRSEKWKNSKWKMKISKWKTIKLDYTRHFQKVENRQEKRLDVWKYIYLPTIIFLIHILLLSYKSVKVYRVDNREVDNGYGPPCNHSNKVL